MKLTSGCGWCGVFLAALAACGPAMGPTVRVATATPAQLAAVEDKDNVWYEFQEGDVIPVQLGFLGVMEGGSREPAVFRAKQHFYFVMFQHAPMQISFDGKSFAGPNSSQSLIGVVPRKDGRGGELGWVIYMGDSGDAKAELEKTLKANKSSEDKPSEAPHE